MIKGRKRFTGAKQRRKSSEVERIFQNLVGNPPEVIDETTEKILDSQVYIKLGQFMGEELQKVKAEKLLPR